MHHWGLYALNVYVKQDKIMSSISRNFAKTKIEHFSFLAETIYGGNENIRG